MGKKLDPMRPVVKGFELELRLMAYENGSPQPFLSIGGINIKPKDLGSAASRLGAKIHLDSLLSQAAQKMLKEDYPILPMGDISSAQQLRLMADMIDSGQLERTNVRVSSVHGNRILQIDFKDRRA